MFGICSIETELNRHSLKMKTCHHRRPRGIEDSKTKTRQYSRLKGYLPSVIQEISPFIQAASDLRRAQRRNWRAGLEEAEGSWKLVGGSLRNFLRGCLVELKEVAQRPALNNAEASCMGQ